MLFFRDNPMDHGVTRLAQARNDLQTARPGAVRCRVCHSAVTDTDNGIAVNGSHSHIFANPHGYVFEIACYKRAAGCRVMLAPSMEFSWFRGYHWQVAICKTCSNHLGWYFQSSESSFYGLIQKNLMG